MLGQGVELEVALVERKLAMYDRKWEPEALEEAIDGLRTEWDRDLQPLLPQFVPDEIPRERVEDLPLSARPPK